MNNTATTAPTDTATILKALNALRGDHLNKAAKYILANINLPRADYWNAKAAEIGDLIERIESAEQDAAYDAVAIEMGLKTSCRPSHDDAAICS